MSFRVHDSGAATLYALMLLPIVWSLGAIAVDVSGWNSLRSTLQHEADRIAFQAAYALPDTTRAEAYADAAGRRLGPEVRVAVTFPKDAPSSVAITLRSKFRATLSVFLGTTSDTAFRVERKAVAQLVPADVVLIVADGATLRPALPKLQGAGHTGFESWGNLLEWPASPYFSCVRPPLLSEANQLSWKWWLDWQRADFRRWATQACFNPVLSPIKRAAIEIVNAVAAGRTNRLALLFTPGEKSSRGYRAARHIHGELELPNSNPDAVGGFFPDPGSVHEVAQASWGGYRELDRFLGDEICMLLSHPNAGLSNTYERPYAATSNGCDEPLVRPPCGATHRSEGHLTECYRKESLSLSDTIYWNAAKLALPDFPARPDIAAALRQAWSELVEHGSPEEQIQERTVRGNIALAARRQVIILTDSIPTVDGASAFSEILEAFDSQHIELTVFALRHGGLSADEDAQLKLHADALAAWRPTSRRTPLIDVITVEDLHTLESTAVSRAVLRGRRIALRS